MSEADDKKLYEGLKYGVELFKYHADQRLRCIRYFIVIFLASVAGIVGLERFLCNREFLSDITVAIILFAICIIAGITLFFWLLDIRNRVLTEYAEKGLKKVENYLFHGNNNLKELEIVNNCEDKKPALHYGIIVPQFFFLVISISILISSSIAIYSYTNLLCFVIEVLFILILFLLLYTGVYSEGEFLEFNPTNNESHDETKADKKTKADKAHEFLFNSMSGTVFRTLGIVFGACCLLIFLAFLILCSCPP